MQGGRQSRRGPRLEVRVSEAKTAELTVGQQLGLREGRASILKVTGCRRDLLLCRLERLLSGLMVGPIGCLVMAFYQSEKYNTLVEKFHHISQFFSNQNTSNQSDDFQQN